jgi:uncharacterized protein (TIRG00374 family)
MLSKRQAAIGIGFWVLIFGAFVTLAGVGDFVEELTAITSSEVAVLLTIVAGGTLSMGSTFYVIQRSLDLGLSWVESIFLNTSVSLAHNLTPFGQAGGEPIAAAIVTQRTDRPYEECLAALSAKDIVSFVPAILVFSFGGTYIVLFEHSIPEELRGIFGAFTAVVVLAVSTFFAIRRYPTVTRTALHRLVGGLNRVVGRLPFFTGFDEKEIERRIHNFSDSMGQVASDRTTVVLSSALATLAFVLQGCLLWFALRSVGVDIPVTLAVFIVPVSLLASGLPLPGGSGGVESVQILMILATTAGTPAAPAITAVVLSRGLVFWTPIVLGSLTLVTIQAQEVTT